MPQRHGTVEIDAELCKGCELCIPACPEHVLAMGDGLRNSKGYPVAELVNPEGCTGCALCALVCPDLAITVYREGRRPAAATARQDGGKAR